MSERSKHLFQFGSSEIAKAAGVEAEYHEKRLKDWSRVHGEAMLKVKETAKVKLQEIPITGGSRFDLTIDYGDAGAYRLMQEAWDKMQNHRKMAEAFRMDEKTYGSQGDRTYELDAADVLHYRLGGGAREE